MIRLEVSPQKAESLIDSISPKKCKENRPLYWKTEANGCVRFPSVCWLFCWAYSGAGSPRVAEEARSVFDAILNISYDEFNRIVGYENSQKYRYNFSYSASQLDAEVAKYLQGREQSAQRERPRRKAPQALPPRAASPRQAPNIQGQDDPVLKLDAFREFKKVIKKVLKKLKG